MIDYQTVMSRFRIEPKGVVHVGAFDGSEDPLYKAIGFADRLFVEAQPDTFQRLAVKLSGSGAFCENYAISDRNGKSTFHVANNGQSSSLLQMHKHLNVYPHITQSATFEIETLRLDDLLSKPPYDGISFNFLNIDIQGAELLALSGACRSLRTFDILNLEINFDALYKDAPHVTDLDSFLSAFDFVRADTFMAHATWGDAIYVRNIYTKA